MDFYDEYFKQEFPPIIFRETVTSDKNPFGQLSPPNGCVRHQFLNFIIKCVGKRYKIEPKVQISFTESFKVYIDNYEQ